MAKTFRSFTQNVVPAVSGTTALQGEFATLTAVGQNKRIVVPTSQWPTNDSRLMYTGWNGNMHWDTTSKTINCMMKSNQSGGDGEAAYNQMAASNMVWTQRYRGYITSGTNDGGNTGHVYNSFDWSFADDTWYGASWYRSLYTWGGASSGAWTEIGSLESPAPFNPTSVTGTVPWAGIVVPNAFPGGVEGILFGKSRLYLCKKDLTSAVQLWARPSNMTIDHPVLLRGNNFHVFTSGKGYAKTNSAFNNPDPRATSEVSVYIIFPDGNGGATVNRIQDAPSAGTGPALKSNDKLCIFDNLIFLFESTAGRGVWTLNPYSSNPTWFKQSYTHEFGVGSEDGQSYIICPIQEYNGIVGLCSQVGSATSEVSNAGPVLSLLKVR